jgi:hypothetical protein
MRLAATSAHTGYDGDTGAGTTIDRESIWFKYTESSDEDGIEIEFDKYRVADDENTEHLEIVAQKHAVAPKIISNEHPRNHSTATVLQKWEKMIRASHGVENTGIDFEYVGKVEDPSRFNKAQSVGVLASNSDTSKPRMVRKPLGLGDVTNKLNPQLSKRSTPKDDRTYSVDTNKSCPRMASSGSKSDNRKNCTNTKEATNGGFNIDDISSNSTVATPPDVAENTTRTRRSFGLGDYNSPSSISTRSKSSSEISKPALNDRISSEKAVYLVQKSNPLTKQSQQTSRRSSNNGDKSGKGRLAAKIEGFKRPNLPRSASSSKASSGLVDSDDYEKILKSNPDEQPMRALVILERRDKCDLIVGEARQNNESEEELVIRKLMLKTEGIECECTRSTFSGNEDLISFYLPQMGMACNCDDKQNELVNPTVPTALENILRPWQVEFLKSLDIHRGEQLVKARQRSADIMAGAMKQWRKKHGMISFKKSSCATALDIWSKVCKAYVRSIRRQTLAGKKGFRLGPADAALLDEMTQFLGDLPTAPKRRNRVLDDAIDLETEVEI